VVVRKTKKLNVIGHHSTHHLMLIKWCSKWYGVLLCMHLYTFFETPIFLPKHDTDLLISLILLPSILYRMLHIFLPDKYHFPMPSSHLTLNSFFPISP
jgi:hypothetical protein